MDLFFYITIIVALSLIYYGYDKKKSYELKMKKIELEGKRLDLELKKAENGTFSAEQERND
ncbi:hypothetical protein [Aquibacillus saliphilus]|uniref:hypothetical protein n=1 Tax=Aquibacillus saliphilus TaxID=1909422 RepID=UPI001CEFFA19|nr:hypothetical protein [Aquibacillus saliphilus]